MSVEHAKEMLHAAIIKMKAQEITPAEFYKELMNILPELEIDDETLKGAIAYLLNFVNTVIKNMEKA
jgi:hypothetical protein